jgi:nucleoside-diphosphate-sugar epimerase
MGLYLDLRNKDTRLGKSGNKQSLVREGYQNPKETYDINIGSTVNLLENCRASESVRVIINVTSDKCYENKEWIWGEGQGDDNTRSPWRRSP